MHPNPRKIAPVVLVILLASAAVWYFTRSAEAETGALTASGTIEAVQVHISAELSGRVSRVAFEEGQLVKAGDVLIEQDTALLTAQRQQSEAALQVVKANQEAADAAAAAAQSALLAVRAVAEAAQANLDLLQAGPSAEQLQVAQTVVDKAKLAVTAAQDNYDALSDTAKDTNQGKALKQQLDQAQASLANAEAQYDLAKAGARSEQVTAAEAQVRSATAQAAASEQQAAAAAAQAKAAAAQVESAQAALNVFDVQIAKLTIVSPVDGVVLARSVQPGEVVAPGATLLALAQISDLTITVFVPEDRYGLILLGQAADLTADSFGGQVFKAKVVHIADQAEFTPRNVQTTEGRRTTVFSVKLAVEDSGGKLKPGMPADVNFGVQP